jgi:hypothetical protein
MSMRQILTTIVFVLCVVPSAAAQQLTVLSAQQANGVLVVKGGPFAAGIRVFMPSGELPVISITSNEIHATMPTSALPEGTHLLFIYQPSTNRYGTFVVAAGGSSPPVVVDAHGEVVGISLGGSVVSRRVNGTTIAVSVDIDGFRESQPIQVDVYFKSADCTGTPYITPFADAVRRGQIVGGLVYYPTDPLEKFIPSSVKTLASNPCSATSPSSPAWFGPMASAPLPALTAPLGVP